MAPDIDVIRHAARQLAPEDRLRLIGELLAELPEVDELSDDEMYEELERRAAEGLANAVSWDDLQKMP